MTQDRPSGATTERATPRATAAGPPATGALRSSAFRRLTVAWTFSNFADSALILILAIWVKDLTGSDAQAGLLLGMFALPALASPLLGQLADRVSRRRLMVVVYGIGGLSVTPLLLVRDASHVWVVFVVAGVYATVGYATAAAQAGLIRDMLPDEAIAPANGRLTTIDQAFRLVVPLLGAGVYVAVGPQAIVVAAGVAFLAGAVVLSTIRLVESPPTAAEDREPFRREVMAGFRHLTSTPPLGALTLALAVGVGVTGILNSTNFATIEQGLGRGPETLGIIASVQGAASVVAGLTAARVIARWGAQRTVAGGLLLAAVGVVTLLGTSYLAILVGVLFAGAGITWAVVGFVTERTLLTPAELQGRVASATHMLLNVPQLCFTVAAAAVIGLVDYRALIAVVLAGVLVSAVMSLRGWTRDPSRTTGAETDLPPTAEVEPQSVR